MTGNPQDPMNPAEPAEPVEPAAGPATEPAQPAEPNGDPEPAQAAEPNGNAANPEPNDWKAWSRHWEDMSKANKKDADEAKASLAAATERAEKAEAELAKLQAANTRAEAVRNAAKAANVDESVLGRMMGETPEEIAENARILAAAAPKGGAYPPVSDGGSGGQSYGMTLEQINAIKDPAARVMARAQYPNAR